MPLKLNKSALKLAVYQQNHLPSLVFITEKYAVQVFSAPNNSTWQILQEVGYLSDQLSKKDISGIDTTAFCAENGIVLVGNKNGNVQVWEIRMEEDRQDALGFKLQFIPVVNSWQHGKAISCVKYIPKYILSISVDNDGCCVVWDIKHNTVIKKMILHAKKINSFEMHKGWLISSSDDLQTKVYRLWIE